MHIDSKTDVHQRVRLELSVLDFEVVILSLLGKWTDKEWAESLASKLVGDGAQELLSKSREWSELAGYPFDIKHKKRKKKS
jgi:hypothetical protein